MTPLLSPLPLPAGRGSNATSGPLPHAWNILPFPAVESLNPTPETQPPLPPLPPESPVSTSGTAAVPFPAGWPSPMAVLPLPAAAEASADPAAETQAPAAERPTLGAEPPGKSSPKPVAARPTATKSDFSDADLSEALGPVIEQAIRRSVYTREHGIDTYLEPMLRATIRRALAEYAPATRPFKGPGTLDRLTWHLSALFTSRTYEDILFEKTRRFQVEEVFLLDVHTLALVSFASCDPARHSSVHRVRNTAQRIALQVRDPNGEVLPQIELDDHRWLVTRQGRHTALVASVRGLPAELLVADLDFALRRIEDHFDKQFAQPGSPLMLAIQPFLEDCLLIQAPASAA